MARNIEVKLPLADAGEAAAVRGRALALATAPEQRLDQDDQFWHVADGRLKLRRFADGSAELIHYRRPDLAGARASDYVRVPLVGAAAADAAEALLDRVLGAGARLGRVRKRRQLVMHGRTRIHLDAVEGLGDWLELEVVLADGEDEAAGHAEAARLLAALGLAGRPAEAGSYLDRLAAGPERGAGAPGAGAG